MTPIQDRRVRVVIEGLVQGVGFRFSCSSQANRLGLRGWVRNLRDGRVEAVFEGPGGQVEAMLTWCRKGPSSARVDGVETHDEPPTGRETGFRIAH